MAGRLRRVVWTREARSALDEVLAYIARDSLPAARRFLTDVLQAASGLAELSERGRVVPELDDQQIRELFVNRYRLIYDVTPAEVRVLASLHGARDFAKWRRDE